MKTSTTTITCDVCGERNGQNAEIENLSETGIRKGGSFYSL